MFDYAAYAALVKQKRGALKLSQEVLASLREAKSGISTSPDHVEHGFRCHVHGEPDLDPFEVLDRRTARFMAKGTAWNYIAMEQAIQDSGLEEGDIINPRTGIIMGSGGPSAGPHSLNWSG